MSCSRLQHQLVKQSTSTKQKILTVSTRTALTRRPVFGKDDDLDDVFIEAPSRKGGRREEDHNPFQKRSSNDGLQQRDNTFTDGNRSRDTFDRPREFNRASNNNFDRPPRSFDRPPRDNFDRPPRDNFDRPPRDNFNRPPRDNFDRPPRNNFDRASRNDFESNRAPRDTFDRPRNNFESDRAPRDNFDRSSRSFDRPPRSDGFTRSAPRDNFAKPYNNDRGFERGSRNNEVPRRNDFNDRNDRKPKSWEQFESDVNASGKEFFLNERAIRGEAVWGSHAVLSALVNNKRRKFYTLYLANNVYDQVMTILALEEPELLSSMTGESGEVDADTAAAMAAITEAAASLSTQQKQFDAVSAYVDALEAAARANLDAQKAAEAEIAAASAAAKALEKAGEESNDDWVDADQGLDTIASEMAKAREQDKELAEKLKAEEIASSRTTSGTYMMSSSASPSRSLGDALAIVRAARAIPLSALRSPAKTLKIVSTNRRSLDAISNNSANNGVLLDCAPINVRKQIVLRAHNFGLGTLPTIEQQEVDAEIEAEDNMDDENLDVEGETPSAAKLLADTVRPVDVLSIDPATITTVAGRKARNMASLLEQGVGVTRPGLVVALDTVQDPQNMGSLLRSSAFFGAQSVLIGDSGIDSSAPITGVVAKAASGALDLMRVNSVANLVEMIRRTRAIGDKYYAPEGDRADEEAIIAATPTQLEALSQGFSQQIDEHGRPVRNWGSVCIVALTAHSDVSVDVSRVDLGDALDAKAPFGILLVVGSEGAGIHPDVLKAAHVHLNLAAAPLASSTMGAIGRSLVDSINVTSASSIALSALLGKYNARKL